MRVGLKKLVRACLIAVAVLFGATLVINIFIIWSTKNYIFERIADLPAQQFELVLGTEPIRPDGSINLHFLNRTKAAATVYLAGKTKEVLISGNRNNRGFNEVVEMKNKIMAKNVPMSALVLDFDGTRTFESIRKAKNVYHLEKVILITNAFHAPRALFYCKHFRIDAIAYCPDRDPFGFWDVRYNVREYFARVKAVFDVLTDRKNDQKQ